MRLALGPRLVIVALALALVTPAAAQAPCAECARGDALIDHFALQPLRSIAGELAATALADPLTADQYARIVETRKRLPVLVRLGAVDDADLSAIAAALCRTATGACVDTTTRALRCIADRCAVDLPPDPQHADLIEQPATCHQYSNTTYSPPFGLGVDWGTGWQRSRYPSDGRAWSFGVEGRMRFGHVLGAVARVDRSAGRDEATDANHDGRDDFSTGSIVRLSALAGPSFVLDNTRYDDSTRSLRIDLLGGYLSTRSQAAESGPAAGIDLAFQASITRMGLRFVQGFGDARDATMLLAHIGFLTGASPTYRDETDCGAAASTRRSRLALGFDFPLGGYGFSSQLGYSVPGIGVELLWHLTPMFDAVTHADLIVFPGGDRDRVLHQAVLGGVRIDHSSHHGHSSTTGFFSTWMAGYTLGAGVTPTTVGSGPIADVSVGWGGQGAEGAGYIRLHGRFGLDSSDSDYRAVFVSGGFELRFDPHSWRDRD